MIKVFFHDSASMPEIEHPIQIAIVTSSGLVTSEGVPSSWDGGRDIGYMAVILKELERVLADDGFLVVNAAFPELGTEKYIIAFANCTRLHPVLDFHVVYPEPSHLSPCVLSNKVEHFFLFSKTHFHPGLKMKHGIMVKTPVPELPHGVKYQFKHTFNADVCRYLIRKLSREGDWLLDPLAGSGMFGQVADALGRNCYLYDIDLSVKALMEKSD